MSARARIEEHHLEMPNPVDVHVGKRLKQRRMELGCTQEKLAQSVGLTFQQVQKYERGSNRIGASRLYQFSRVLKIPVSYFFEGGDFEDDFTPPDFSFNGVSHSVCAYSPSFVGACQDEDISSNREKNEFVSAFEKISDSRVRQDVLNLIRTLSSAKQDL